MFLTFSFKEISQQEKIAVQTGLFFYYLHQYKTLTQ